MPKPKSLLLAFLFILPASLYAETIHYSIRQIGFDGQAALTMAGPKEYRGHKTILIVFRAHGVNYWDEEKIYVHPKTYKPLFVLRDFSLGIFGHGKIVEEYSSREVKVTKTSDGKTTSQVIHAKDVDNIYGFIYRYRRQGSFRIGDTVDMPLARRTLKIRLVKLTRLKIGPRWYSAYYMQSQPSKYKIWFDASKNKVPLRITGSLGFINSVMTMTDYEE